MIGLLTHGWWMTHLAERGPGRTWHYSLHALIAMYFVLLLALRIVWRLGDQTPHQPSGTSRWETTSAHLAHLALYALLIAMVITGYLMWSSLPARIEPARAAMWDLRWFGIVKVPAAYALPARDVTKYWEAWHELLSHVLQVIVVVHILAALWHRFVRRDRVLQRMLHGGV